MKKIYLFNLILLIGFSVPIKGQLNTISGVVIEKENKNPISFATIYYENTDVGTISNTEGAFSIEKLDGRNLIFSCLGYKTLKIDEKELSTDSLSALLESQIFQLNEIVITPIEIEELLKKAIDLKPKNYPNQPTIICGSYKQSTKQNNEYIRFLEADLNIYRPDYKSSEKNLDDIKVINAKASEDKSIDILYETFVLHSILKASKFTIKSQYLENYLLSLDIIKDYNNRSTYLITMKPKNDKAKLHVKLYIDKETYAIVAIDFKNKIGKLDYNEKLAKNYRYKDKKTKFCTKESFHYLITYREKNDKWHLDYIHADNKIIAFNNKDTVTFEDKCDFLTSSIITNNVTPFDKKDIVKLNTDIYSKSITDKEMFNQPNKIIDTKDEEKSKIRLQNKP